MRRILVAKSYVIPLKAWESKSLTASGKDKSQWADVQIKFYTSK